MNFNAKVTSLVRRAAKISAKGTSANYKTAANLEDQIERALYSKQNTLHDRDQELIKALVDVHSITFAIRFPRMH